MNAASLQLRTLVDDRSESIDRPLSLIQRLEAIDGVDSNLRDSLAVALSGNTLHLGMLDAQAVTHLPPEAWTALDDAAGGVSNVILPPNMSCMPEAMLCYPQLSYIEAPAYEGVELNLRPQAAENLARRCIALYISRQEPGRNVTVWPGMDDIVSVGPPDDGLLQASTNSSGEPTFVPIHRWTHPDTRGRGFSETSVAEPSPTATPEEIIENLHLTSIHKDCLRHALCRRTLDLRTLPPWVVLRLPGQLWRAWALVFSRKKSAADRGLRLRLPAKMTRYPTHANHLDLDVLEVHDFRGLEIDLTAFPPGSRPSKRFHTLTLDLGARTASTGLPAPPKRPPPFDVYTLDTTLVDVRGDAPPRSPVKIRVMSLLPTGDWVEYSNYAPTPADRPSPAETLAALNALPSHDVPSLDRTGCVYVEMGQAIVFPPAADPNTRPCEVHTSQLFSCMLISGIGLDGRFGVYHYPAKQLHAPETRATLELWLAALQPTSLWIQARDPATGGLFPIRRMLAQDLDAMHAWAHHHCPNQVVIDLKRLYDEPCSAYVNGDVQVGDAREVTQSYTGRRAKLQELPAGICQGSDGRSALLLGRNMMKQPVESDSESDSESSSDDD